jgi:serine/threonine-protein kinase
MPDVFVSYKAEDRRRIEPLVRALETDGFSVWWDAHIGGGDRWRETILKNLEQSPCVIVAWSKRSIGSDGEFVQDEATRAKRLGTYLPVCIDKVDPPLGFGEMQSLSLQGWKGDSADARYQAILDAVRHRVGHEAVAYHYKPARGVSRRTAIAAGAGVATVAVAVAVAATGTWWLSGSAKAAPSIAVLPFANLSGDPAQSYISDGIAEELRSALARIPGLKVVARTSSEAVRNADAQSAAAKLHVTNILTGSVRRSPQTIRVSAQLIDGRNGTERWSEVYDRPVGDALKLQSDIANMVAQALSIHLGADEQQAIKEGGTTISDAQDLLLQAQEIVWRSDDEASVQRAMELMDRALALDPKYADALTAKASMLAYLAGYLGKSAEDARSKDRAAETYARQAIALAPRSAQAHGALANILWIHLQLKPAFSEFQRMEQLPGATSSFFNVIDPCTLAFSQCRRFAEAFARADRLIAADPLNPNAYLSKAIALGHARRYSEAEQLAKEAIAQGPQLIWPRALHAFYVMQMGQLAQARAEFTSLGGSGPWLAWAAALAVRQGRQSDAEQMVSAMHQSMGNGGNYQYAQVFAQQSRNDEAIAALQQAWAAADPGLTFLQIDPMFDPVRKDPRFQALIRRLDFPA